MSVNVFTSLTGRAEVPTMGEHTSLKKKVQTQKEAIDEHARLLEEGENILGELKAEIEIQKKKNGALQRTLEEYRKLSCSRIDEIDVSVASLKQKLNGVEFESEVEAMFQRQFNRFDQSCKAYGNAKTDLEMASDGLQKSLNDLSQRHLATINETMESARREADLASTALSANLSQSLSHLSEEASGRSALIEQASSRALDSIEVSQREHLAKLTDALHQQVENEQGKLLELLTDVRRLASDMAVSAEFVKTGLEDDKRAINAWRDLNARSWSAFWNRLIWIFRGDPSSDKSQDHTSLDG